MTLMSSCKDFQEELSCDKSYTSNLENKDYTSKVTDLCPICGGVGFIVKRDKKYQDIISPCSCTVKNNIKSKWKFSGLNVDSSQLSLKNYKIYNTITKKCKTAALNYLKSFSQIKNTRHNSIAFLGQVGSGKSHLCTAIAINLIDLGVKVIYMPYRDVINKIKQNMLDEESYSSLIGKYKTSELIVIDDLFKGKITESDINILFEIINFRYLNNYPIIISSEYTMEKLLELDEAVGSRILEMCRGNTIEIQEKENNYRVNGEA